MASWKLIEQESRRKSVLFTLLFTGALVVAMLLISFKAPDLVIEEDLSEGLLVDFGFDETGYGTNEFIPEQSAAPSAPVTAPDKQIATQEVEKTVSVPKTEPKKTTTTTTTTNTTQTSTIDKDLLFNKDKVNNNSGGDGNTSGSGNMGKPDGDLNGYQGDGSGFGDDGKIGWSLNGRGKVALPSPPPAQNQEGDIRIKISVDRNGNVVSAEYERSGSTITDPTLKSQAIAAAKKAKFTAKADAESIQIGYITYRYRYN